MLKQELLDICKNFKIKCLSSDKKVTLQRKLKEHLKKVLTKKQQKGKGDMDKCQKNNYTFAEIIGSGGFGSVYVACKNSNMFSPEGECNFVAKVQVIRQNDDHKAELDIYNIIGHNNQSTPKLYDHWYCTVEGVKYGVMILEKMDGDMQDLINETNPSEDELGLWLVDIYNKFSLFQQYNILHNDMKPANILYKELSDGDYEFFITDFSWSHQYPNDVSDYFGNYKKIYNLWKVPEKYNDNFDIVCLIFFMVHYSEKNYDVKKIVGSLDKYGNAMGFKDLSDDILLDLQNMFAKYFSFSPMSTQYYNALFNIPVRAPPKSKNKGKFTSEDIVFSSSSKKSSPKKKSPKKKSSKKAMMSSLDNISSSNFS